MTALPPPGGYTRARGTPRHRPRGPPRKVGPAEAAAAAAEEEEEAAATAELAAEAA